MLPVVAFAQPTAIRVATPSLTSTIGVLDSLNANTDTGAFMPGNREFARFTTPGECAAAAQNLDSVLHRSIAAQVSMLRDSAPDRDTIPLQARAVARACGDRYTLVNTALVELPYLFTLAVLAGHDSLARAVTVRRLALAKDTEAREVILGKETQEYLAADPARVSEAEWTVALSDSLARGGKGNPLRAHGWLVRYWLTLFNRVKMRETADQMLAAGVTVPFDTLNQVTYLNPNPDSLGSCRWVAKVWGYGSQARRVFYEHPDSMMPIATVAKADLQRFNQDCVFPFSFRSASAKDVLDYLWAYNSTQGYGTVRTIPPVEETLAWYPAPPVAWPPQGSVTLLLYNWHCAQNDKLLGPEPLSNGCDMLHRQLPNWIAQYGKRGFAAMLVAHVEGFAVRSVPVPPAVEADSVNWYYRTYLKLPITVGVMRQSLADSVPDPDGRRWYSDDTDLGLLSDQVRQASDLQLAVLFGRDGSLLYVGALDETGLYTLLDAMIRRAMDTPMSTPSGLPVGTPGSDPVSSLAPSRTF